jgi:hypothetical protein
MAKDGTKSGGRDFKPGQSGNPYGRPPIPADLKAARAESKEALERSLHECAKRSLKEIKELTKDASLSGLEALVVSIWSRAVENADYQRANFLLERMLGKVPEQVNHSGSLHSMLVHAMKDHK